MLLHEFIERERRPLVLLVYSYFLIINHSIHPIPMRTPDFWVISGVLHPLRFRRGLSQQSHEIYPRPVINPCAVCPSLLRRGWSSVFLCNVLEEPSVRA
jgi:hypothetical protein